MARLSIEHITRKSIVITLIALGVFALVVHAGAFLLFKHYYRTPVITPLEQEALHKPPGPLLESSTGETLRQLRAREEVILNSYGWVDRRRGLIRIPIERAIELETSNKDAGL